MVLARRLRERFPDSAVPLNTVEDPGMMPSHRQGPPEKPAGPPQPPRERKPLFTRRNETGEYEPYTMRGFTKDWTRPFSKAANFLSGGIGIHSSKGSTGIGQSKDISDRRVLDYLRQRKAAGASIQDILADPVLTRCKCHPGAVRDDLFHAVGHPALGRGAVPSFS